jgi:hypothetical protein
MGRSGLPPGHSDAKAAKEAKEAKEAKAAERRLAAREAALLEARSLVSTPAT